MWMQGGAARMFTLFKQYVLNMSYWMGKQAVLSVKGRSAVEKKEARTRLRWMLFNSWVMSGAKGLPIAISGLPLLYYGLLGALGLDDEDDPADAKHEAHRLLAEATSKKVADIIMNGPVDALSPISISGNVALDQLWWREPDPFASPQDQMRGVIFDLLGPIAAMVADKPARMLSALGEGQKWRAAEALAPHAVRDLLKATRYAQDGMQTWHTPPRELISPDEFDISDIVVQALGFTPSKVTRVYDENAAIETKMRLLQDRRAHLVAAYVTALSVGDEGVIEDTIGKILSWNESHPQMDQRIRVQTLFSSARQRYRNNARAVNGVVLPDHWRELFDEYDLYSD